MQKTKVDFHLTAFKIALVFGLAFIPSPAIDFPWQAEQWRYLVEIYLEDFDNLDEANIIIAIIAKESYGDRYKIGISPNGNPDVGLMQITARTWTGTVEQLLSPEYNIWTGMWMLDNILDKTDGDLRWALAAYNCGFESLAADKCYFRDIRRSYIRGDFTE